MIYSAFPLHALYLICGFLVHGQVLEQWPNMFRILSLFCEYISTVATCSALSDDPDPVANRGQATELQGDEESSASTGDGSCLVRIPIDELQVSKPAS